MKLALYIFLTTLFSSTIYAQVDKNKIYYLNGEMYTFISNNKNEIIEKTAIGKNVMISYDPFFLSYSIIWDNEKGTSNSTKFSYATTITNSNLRLYKSQINHDKRFHIIDTLNSNGVLLIFLYEKLNNNFFTGYAIINVEKYIL